MFTPKKTSHSNKVSKKVLYTLRLLVLCILMKMITKCYF